MFKYKIDNMYAIVSEVQKYTQRAYKENPKELGSPVLFRKLFPSIFDKICSNNEYKITTNEQMVILLSKNKVTFKSEGIILHEMTLQNQNNSHPIDEYVNDFFSNVYQELEAIRSRYKLIDEEKKNNVMSKFIKNKNSGVPQ